MKPSDSLELFRLEVDDTIEPYLWSDSEFYTYLTDAHDLHVRLIGGIADRTDPLTRLAYKENDQFLKYDDRILRIKGAWDETNRRITLKNLDNFESEYLDDDYGRLAYRGLDDGKTGDIRFLVTDVEDLKVQLYPLPDHDGWIRLFVYRRPLEKINEFSTEFEIPSQHHLNLLNWVKYKAFMKQDVETFDGTKALEFRAAFTEGITDAKRDKASREDRKRTVVYGGIPMQ
jgi:hypothetical protein